MHRHAAVIEHLENRVLLSAAASVVVGTPLESGGPVVAAPVASTGTGFTLHLTAGVPFSGKVAFYPSPVLDPPFAYSGTIDWGDGTTAAATLGYGSQGNASGVIFSGAHQYVKAGTYTIKTSVLYGPLPGSGIEVPTRVLTTIKSKAIVAARPANSSGGVSINEVAGKKFTANVGSFMYIAPGTGLSATINWGDGKISSGKLSAAGIVGIDVIKYNIAGTHTYAMPGIYPITVTVTRSFPLAGSAIQLITTIHSTASVSLPLAGTITGTYTIPPLLNPDAGVTYIFNGSGNAGALGAVTATGSVRLPGFIASGKATGTLTLSNSQGSVSLQLTGPMQAGFGAFPSTLNFVITSATGAYANDGDAGAIKVTLQPGAGGNVFKFIIS
jgi:hypothetical protein